MIDAETKAVNADEAKRQVTEETGASPSTVWRAFVEMKDAGLAGATPERDEQGAITEWRWFAKPELLVGRGDA